METEVENGVYMAVPYDVLSLFGTFLSGWTNDPCVYPVNPTRPMGNRFERELDSVYLLWVIE